MEKLIESFKMKCRQLHHAISTGDDVLVSALDRDIEPLIDRIVQSRASDSSELRAQLQLVCDLIRDDAGDKNRVLRNAAIMTVLLNRYLADGDSGSNRDFLRPDRLAEPVEGDTANQATGHQAILDSLSDRIYMVTPDYRIAYANQAAARYHRTSPFAMMGRLISEYCGACRFALDYQPAIDTCFSDQDTVISLKIAGDNDKCDPATVAVNAVKPPRGAVVAVMISERLG